VLDPKTQKADDLGLWLPPGDHVYVEYLDRDRNLIVAPIDGDITAAYTQKRFGRAYPYLGGVDFNGTPHICGVVFRIFGTVDVPIFHAVDEVISPDIGSSSTTATEEEFLHDLETAGYDPTRIGLVGDATGQHQDGKHSGPTRTSFRVVQSWRYRMVPPRAKKSDKGEWSSNPPVEDRINITNKLLSEGRFRIDPNGCPWLVESLQKCPMRTVDGRRKPYGKYTHITDAAGYVLFWGEPAPRAPMPSWPGGKVPFAIASLSTSKKYRML
jgi:hypothetical protein